MGENKNCLIYLNNINSILKVGIIQSVIEPYLVLFEGICIYLYHSKNRTEIFALLNCKISVRIVKELYLITKLCNNAV